MSRIGVLWRELRPDRNPLRRACDRAEAGVLAVVIAVFLVAVPLAAVITGGGTYAAGLRAERAEQAAWREVPAVLLAAAPASGYDATRAAWTAPDGARRAGPVTAPAGTPAGHTVRLWVDASGQPTGQPLQPDDVISRAATMAVVAASGAAAALLGTAAAARWALFRRRLAAWDSEWRITGPRWTSLR